VSEAALRVAIVGYGVAGRFFHAPLVSAEPGMRVAAIVTSDPERAAAAAREHPGARILDSAERVWAAPGEFDLLVVAAPNRAHVPLALAAIAARIPVVVDKPLAPDAAGARALVGAARDAGVMLSVFQNRRWDGDFLTVRRLLAEGAVGAPVRFESRFDRWRPRVDVSRWRERPGAEEAGGLLADLGSHLIDQAIVLFGRPVEVHAELDMVRAGAQVDDEVFLSLTHPGGVRSHLGASVLSGVPAPRMRLVGRAATYEVFGLDPQEDALRAGARPGGRDWGRDPPGRWGRLGDGGEPRPVETEPGDYPAFYAAVARHLRGEGPVPVDPAGAVAVLEVIDAARVAQRGRGGG